MTTEAPITEAIAEAAALELREQGAKALVDPWVHGLRVAERYRQLTAEPSPPPTEIRCYDLRHEQDYVYPGGRRKVRVRNGEPVRRDPSTVTGIVLHQTAVEFSVSERQVRASDGDADLAMARRGLDVACHAIAFRRGFYTIAHDLPVWVNHGNGLNRSTLGLEVDGRYPGLESRPGPTTWGGEPTLLTEQTIETARAALRWLVEEGRAQGMPIEVLYAHRQSSATRRSDPGEGLWRSVAEWSVDALGLRLEPGYAVGDGRPIPRDWSERGSVAY